MRFNGLQIDLRFHFGAGAIFSTIVVLGLTASAPAKAGVILVPKDQPTIQSGIDAAVDGDLVLIAPGTYRGPGNVNLDFRGKAITVSGKKSATTIIDCEQKARGFILQNGESTDSVIAGLTITHGNGLRSYGGAIACLKKASASVVRCIIIDNTSDVQGGGVYSDGPLSLINCVVARNTAFEVGGDIVVRSHGGGVYCQQLTAIHCTFVDNDADHGSGLTTSGRVVNCIIWGNSLEGTPETLEGSLVDKDPRFMDPAHGNYRLQTSSTAIDLGVPWLVTPAVDLDGACRSCGQQVDAGAYETCAVTAAGPDTDGDAVPDACDRCPALQDPAQLDLDSDGLGDGCDLCPLVANSAEEPGDCQDCDQDGIADGYELAQDPEKDCNSNGIPDRCDLRLTLEQVKKVVLPPTPEAASFAFADLNDDGQGDHVLLEQAVPSTLLVSLATGNGLFLRPSAYATGGWSSFAWRTADYTSDGSPDVVVYHTDGPVSLLGNDGSGAFEIKQTIRSKVLAGPSKQVPSADLDGDGDLDLVYLLVEDPPQPTGPTVALLMNNGESGFAGPKKVPVPVPNSRMVLLGDMDGDGRQDILTLGGPASESSVSILRNTQESFELMTTVRLPSTQVLLPWHLITAESDGDGDRDLFVLTLSPISFTSLTNLGAGSFQEPTVWTKFPGVLEYASLASSPEAADLDRDGIDDLIVSATSTPAAVFLLHGSEQGSFQEWQEIGTSPFLASPRDVNADGLKDILVIPDSLAAKRTGVMETYLNKGSFSPDRNGNGRPDECEGGWLLPGDSNADGTIDVTDPVFTLGFLFLGSPSTLPCDAGSKTSAGSLLLIDVSGDGILDLSDAVALLGFIFLGHPGHVLGTECIRIADCPEACAQR